MAKRRETGGAYKRGAVWWIWYTVAGERIYESAKTADKRLASALLAQRRRELREGTWTHPKTGGAMREAERLRARLEELAPQIAAEESDALTVAKHAEAWLAARRKAGVRNVECEARRLRDFVLPAIGEMPLASVKRTHIRDIVLDVQATKSRRGTPYSARSVLHVYKAIRTMFGDAVKDEVLASSPCTLTTRRGELPALRDADPLWRARAVYTRDEAEALISDERIPDDRRVLNALEILGGLRIGEAVGRRFRDLDHAAQPLGRMTVATQIGRDGKERPTKTGDTRMVPLHPTLAAVLATWKLGGFARVYGRHPTPDDFLVPSRRDVDSPKSRTTIATLKRDLVRLGLRSTGRGQHAMRATFLTLLEADGANMEIASRATHAPPSDVVGGYVRTGWAELCREVEKLRLEVRRGAAVIPMRRVAGADPNCYNPCDSGDETRGEPRKQGSKRVVSCRPSMPEHGSIGESVDRVATSRPRKRRTSDRSSIGKTQSVTHVTAPALAATVIGWDAMEMTLWRETQDERAEAREE